MDRAQLMSKDLFLIFSPADQIEFGAHKNSWTKYHTTEGYLLLEKKKKACLT